MNLIWAFQFSPPLDTVTGTPLPVDIFAYEKGMITAPCPFQCQITPRSDSKAKLIKAAFRNAADTFVRFENGISAEDKEWVRNHRCSNDHVQCVCMLVKRKRAEDGVQSPGDEGKNRCDVFCTHSKLPLPHSTCVFLSCD
ncbi:hypothetical protein ARMSODRAFT_395076 [Armillaria solidipes]|uniref:Uncharacterized protein n=1 Tax=Armillaria solidipes TaxID=1076256 RepID=A0A2H3C8J1_9AGAR|nr:hypothetical protein ARMSODRAFT_395076 [Armillaria solidipes]